MNQYGPAALVGVLIGGAILLDDYIGPEPRQQTMMKMHNIDASAPGHKGIWIEKGGDEIMELHEEVSMVLIKEDGEVNGDEDMMVVQVEVDGAETTMLAETVRAIVEKAKAEGTKPDPEELKAAVMALVDGEDGAVTVDVDIAIEEVP